MMPSTSMQMPSATSAIPKLRGACALASSAASFAFWKTWKIVKEWVTLLREYAVVIIDGIALAEAMERTLAAEKDAIQAAATQAERERMTGLDPRRADVILAGALILDRVAAAAGVDEVRVSDRGIRWGLFHELTT